MTAVDKALLKAIENVEDKVETLASGGSITEPGSIKAHSHAISDVTNLPEKLNIIETEIVQLMNKGDSSSSSSGNVTLTSNPFKDKWVSILGDDVSTYTWYIPQGNDTFYPTSDVDSVSKIWWHLLLSKLGAKLCVNDSYTNRTIMGEDERSARKGVENLGRKKGQTYINLDGKTEEATEDVKPDIILVQLGTHDFHVGSELGTAIKSAQTMSVTTDFYNTLYSLTVILINLYPNAQIYWLDSTYSNYYNLLGENPKNVYQSDYAWAITENARLFGCNVIHTSRIGVNANNIKDNTTDDKWHPKALMMRKIANQCYHEMTASNCFD